MEKICAFNLQQVFFHYRDSLDTIFEKRMNEMKSFEPCKRCASVEAISP
jgi:hypothetical protein